MLWWSSKHEEIRLSHEIVFVLIFYSIGAILSKKCQSEGFKKVKNRERGRSAIEKCFLKKGGLKMRGVMHLQENYEKEEFYFSLPHYSMMHHFLIMFN